MRWFQATIAVAALAACATGAHAQRACPGGGRGATGTETSLTATLPIATSSSSVLATELAQRVYLQQLAEERALRQAYFAQQLQLQQQILEHQRALATEQAAARQRKIAAREERRLAAEAKREAAKARRLAAQSAVTADRVVKN